jgi:hypothetical protein
MAKETKKVKVELAARCHVDGREREAGEVVEVDAEIAKFFGKVVKEEKPVVTAAEKSA